MSDLEDTGDVSSFDAPRIDAEISKNLLSTIQDIYLNIDPEILRSCLAYDYTKEQREIIIQAIHSRTSERIVDDLLQSPELVSFLDSLIEAIAGTIISLQEEGDDDEPLEE